jgi:hypothetical protein
LSWFVVSIDLILPLRCVGMSGSFLYHFKKN